MIIRYLTQLDRIRLTDFPITCSSFALHLSFYQLINCQTNGSAACDLRLQTVNYNDCSWCIKKNCDLLTFNYSWRANLKPGMLLN